MDSNVSKTNKRNLKRGWVLWLIDIIIIILCFLYIAKLKPATVRIVLPKYTDPFYVFAVVWSMVSFITGKYFLIRKLRRKDYLLMILLSNAAITGVISFAVYFLGYANFSRLIVFGTIGAATLAELVLASIYTYYIKLNRKGFYYEGEPEGRLTDPFTERAERRRERKRLDAITDLDESLIEASSKAVHDFILEHADINADTTFMLSTSTLFNVQKLSKNTYDCIINLKRINDLRHINTFFRTVNNRLPVGGTYILSAETASMRKERILRKYPPGLNIIATWLDYMLKRVAPKIKLTRGLYFLLTRGENRALTHVEILGRLYYSGFELVEYRRIENLCFYVVSKKGPARTDSNPTYGPLVRLRRFGKEGKVIGVYKFRTMYPYSEYLQDYVFQKNSLQVGGKLKDDFRVSPMGKFLRKVWLDEFPMLLNLLKGEIKIVGVRPLSKQYFNLYSQELQTKRIQVKPGLIPPFYVDLPKTLDEIQESEMRYLESYMQRPLKTDWHYFWQAVYNITLKKARSA